MPDKLNMHVEKTMTTVDHYEFEPIKGYPMLRWAGKRPFRSTQFFPAQLRENYGEPIKDWMNQIFWGDNLQVMSHLLKEYRGKIQLIYIDPPFDSKADYKKKISLRGKKITNDHTSFEEKQYTDIWSNDEYLQFIYERLILVKELLAPTGGVFLHCDWHKSHYLRLILDEVFGQENFVNEIIWFYPSGSDPSKCFNRKHDNIFWYARSKSEYFYNFDAVAIPYTEDQARRFKEIDENGKRFYWNVNPRGERVRTYMKSGIGEYDVWNIGIDATSIKNINYPTTKPEKVLERIIKAASNYGDIVFDCFMGSGTTQVVAMKLGRRFIGADINLGAIQTSTKRLIGVAKELVQEISVPGEEKFTGFSVYNVNNYDVFRNPVEAKDLLIKALEVQPLPGNTLFDGEKDGRFVKLMPVNRIATRADLNILITNFDYKAFEKAAIDNPGRAVIELTLVCMGHEPDLAAALQEQVKYKLDIEIVDILRDKSALEFKRDSEAEIVRENGKLIIKQFYPLNLLQKLSLQKETVGEWRELVESVMIDFNYDGGVFEPTLLDIPEKDEFVSGKYEIPSGAGTIRIKITDLLSESLEMEVK